ncbi:MAG: Arm DNA-binding domain-containing protein [Deltaproteobacteria bacterium]|nr:Arm DNA-binding domain-containing protein [Deltaproteobacteria bacterium]
MVYHLTERLVRSLEPGQKPYISYDGSGLYLKVTPRGSKLWRVKFAHLGKGHLKSLGEWPGVSLRQARELAESGFSFPKAAGGKR